MKAELERTGGHISRTAWLMNVGRTTLYRWIEHWQLWPEVNASRRKRFEGEPVVENEASTLLHNTRLALRS